MGNSNKSPFAQYYRQESIGIFSEGQDLYPGYKPAQKPQLNQVDRIPKQSIIAQEMQPKPPYYQDRRQKVGDPLQYPYSAIGMLTVIINGKKYRGTGFLVSQRVVLTCAHYMFDRASHKKAEKITFWPGTNGEKGKGYAIKQWQYNKKWEFAKEPEKNQYDYGFLQLEEAAGISYGYLGVSFKAGFKETGVATLIGYPINLYKQGKEFPADGCMYSHEAEYFTLIQSLNMKHSIQASEGNCGSPICQMTPLGPIVIGIHTIHQSHPYNLALLMSGDVKQLINTWITVEERVLDLQLQSLGDLGAKQVADDKQFDLTELNMWDNEISEKGAKSIASGQWDSLKDLNIGYNQIGNEGVKSILSAKWPNLTSLNISYNQIDEAGIKLLTQGNWPKLSALDLSACKIEENAAKDLGDGKWPYLTTLILQNNPMGDKGIKKLRQHPWQYLTILNIGSNKISEKGAKHLKKNKWPYLTYLNLRDNKLGYQGAKFLAQIKWPYLNTLYLGNNSIMDKGMIEIAHGQWFNLANLFLWNNHIGDEGITYLVERMHCNLASLDLCENQITDNGVKCFTKNPWSNLNTLLLCENHLQDKGLKALTKTKWKNMVLLDVRGNKIGQKLKTTIKKEFDYVKF